MKGWNMFAEALGFISGILLLVPALALNSHLRKVGTTLTTLKGAVTKFGTQVASQSTAELEKQKVPEWSKTDERMLQWGALCLVVSFGIKFVVLWLGP